MPGSVTGPRRACDLLAVLALGRAQTLLLDKTGTLTGGRQKVSDLVCAPGVTAEEMLAAAAGKILARPRRHAVGGSIWRAWCG